MRVRWAHFVARPLPLAAALIVGLSACKEPTRAPEAGAFLLRLAVASTVPVPDEVRLSIFDDTGALWKDVRFPDEGGLTPESGTQLGSILIQPGVFQGDLRLHVRALVQGTRALEAVLRIQRDAVSRATFDLALESAALADVDLDDVPDQIDDCPAAFNPGQQGCPDAGVVEPDGAALVDALDDAPDVGPADGAGSSDVATGMDAPGGADMTSPSDAGGMADLAPGPDAGAGADVTPARDAASDVTVDAAADSAADGAAPPDAQAPDVVKANGETCAAAAECRSEMCVDGVCCESACLGTCRSCNQPGRDGTCVGHALGTDPERNCTGGATCNGAGACGPAPTGRKANGQLCGATTECMSGFCVDGVCCDNACNLECQSCAAGTCQSVTRMQDIPQCVSPRRCNPQAKCS